MTKEERADMFELVKYNIKQLEARISERKRTYGKYVCKNKLNRLERDLISYKLILSSLKVKDAWVTKWIEREKEDK